MSDKLPDYLLERLALGELPEKAAREARERLAKEPDGARRPADLQASNAELLARHPPAEVAREITRRWRAVAIQFRRRRMAWLAVPAGVVAAAVLAIVLRPSPEVILTKGDAALLVYARRGGQNVLLQRGDTVRAGEAVQIAYRAGAGYGAIVSLDGGGGVTLHLPVQPGEAARLVPHQTTRLEGSFELDAAPAFERFFLVTSESAFPTSAAVEAARQLAARGDLARSDPLPLPSRFAQTSFLVLKASP